MLKNDTNMLPKKLNATKQREMTFQSSIVEKMNTFLDEVIHIMPKCVMHLHGHQNKMVPFMKLVILMNLNNGVKFHNCTFWSINDTRSHHLLCWVSNHHIDNKDLVPTSHVKIDL